MTFRHLLALGLCAAAALGACGEEDDGDGEQAGSCAEGISYEKVGKPFADAYCVSCHSKDAADRRGASPGANFDTLDGIKAHGMHVFEEVVDETMPPPFAEAQPSQEERADFVNWLDCAGIAELEHEH